MLQREFVKAGLVGERSNQPPSFSSLENILKNPFYYGLFSFDGVLHQGIHEPMISKETFEKIQRVRAAVSGGKYNRDDKKFAFLQFARCGSCGFCITGEFHRKRSGRCYRYYRCSHKNKATRCDSRTFLRDDKMAEEVVRNARLVAIPDDWKERYLAKIETWEAVDNEARSRQGVALRAEQAEIKAKIERLNFGFTEGAISVQEFRELKNPLVQRKAALEAKIEALEGKNALRLEPLRNWVLEANSVGNALDSQDLPELRRILEKAGSNRVLRAQSLDVSFLKPWQALAEANSSATADNELTHVSIKWWR